MWSSLISYGKVAARTFSKRPYSPQTNATVHICQTMAFVLECTLWNTYIFLMLLASSQKCFHTDPHLSEKPSEASDVLCHRVWVFLDCEVTIIIYTLQAAAEMQRPVGGVIANKLQEETTAAFIWSPERDRSAWKRCYRDTKTQI